MKKKKYMIVVGVLMLGWLVGCSKTSTKEDKQIIEETTISDDAKEKATISDEILENINQLFELELPSKGDVVYYDSLLEKNQLGYIYAEIEFHEKYYEDVINQLGVEFTNPSKNISFNEDNRFQTTLEEIDKTYMRGDDFRREVSVENMEYAPFKVIYRIDVTKVENGIFRILFSANPC